MKRTRRRGLGLRAQLLLVSAGLLALPWLVVRYQDRLDDFVLEGRRSALGLAAQGVATVLHDRRDLFEGSAGIPVTLGAGEDLVPLPLEAPVRLDGDGRDWSALGDRRRHHGARSVLRAEGDASATLDFDLSLGHHREHLYALFEVRDDVVVHRPTRYRSLDRSDHLRIGLRDPGGMLRRYVVTAARDGATTAYEVGESWRYAQGQGRPVPEIRGEWRSHARGYTVELRLPLAMLGPRREAGFAVADADRANAAVTHVVGTFPDDPKAPLGRVHLGTAELERILTGLALADARISVRDRQGRVRAKVGAALPATARLSGATALTRAERPIVSSHGAALGAVAVEQSNQSILGPQQAALERVLLWMGAVCAVIALALWLFAWRAARRIHRLRDDLNDAIDDEGRVRRAGLRASRGARDELGDLSRTISDLLARLARHARFLEEIPRTLRHELSNPVNTLSTSLQNLVHEHPEVEGSKYVASAERGIARVGAILEGLTDAASLEDALRDDETEPFDLALLVARYVENFAAGCPERRFTLRGAEKPAVVVGSDIRCEQLLDKLFDNAVAFGQPGGEIEVTLATGDDTVRLEIANEGPRLPAALGPRIFDSMVSGRAARASDRAHLGLGLYIARLIAVHLGGRIDARDREDGRGVVVRVTLPRCS